MRTLDQWAKQVEGETERLRPQFDRHPEEFNHSWAMFRALALVTVLQRDIGIRYNPGLIERDDFFTDARNLFLHGVIDTRQGTCSSLPPLYLAVGRRLGYPLKLVTTASHLFVRWDDAGGERFNIECTSLGMNSYPEEHYRTWPVKVTNEQVAAFRFLHSHSPREELAAFLGCRGHCSLFNEDYRGAAQAYAWARVADPLCDLLLYSLEETLKRWRARVASLLPPPWPAVSIRRGPSRFPGMFWMTEAEILYVEFLDSLTRDSRFIRAYEVPTNRSPHTGVPVGLPESIVLNYSPPLTLDQKE
jgi:hypothetical protein